MKTKLEMAHEYAIALINSDCEMQFDKFIRLCWNYADAMQAEADKRAHKEPRETHKKLAEFKMYPEYDASINYPPDAWVMYKGEKRLAVSIDIKKEWQPDWSQAPKNMNYFFVNKDGSKFWTINEPDKPNLTEHVMNFSDCGGDCYAYASSQDYKGCWRESLRKRPQ